MKAFAFTDFEYVLSRRALEDRGDTDAIAEQAIRNAFESHELPYTVDEGGGAFYGPKLDINVRDALGRPWQLGTVQVDFVLPERFELKYRGSDGLDHRPATCDSPRACRVARTLLRNADLALRRSLPRLAGADPGRRCADIRE